MTTPNKLIEGSPAEEATETPAFEKKEDAKSKGKKGKRVSARGAKLMANLMKAKGAKAKVAVTAPVDAEDKLEGGEEDE